MCLVVRVNIATTSSTDSASHYTQPDVSSSGSPKKNTTEGALRCAAILPYNAILFLNYSPGALAHF